MVSAVSESLHTVLLNRALITSIKILIHRGLCGVLPPGCIYNIKSHSLLRHRMLQISPCGRLSKCGIKSENAAPLLCFQSGALSCNRGLSWGLSTSVQLSFIHSLKIAFPFSLEEKAVSLNIIITFKKSEMPGELGQTGVNHTYCKSRKQKMLCNYSTVYGELICLDSTFPPHCSACFYSL